MSGKSLWLSAVVCVIVTAGCGRTSQSSTIAEDAPTRVADAEKEPIALAGAEGQVDVAQKVDAVKEAIENKEPAPAQYKVKFVTSAGDFVVQINRDWSPNGADRFYHMVKAGFYDDAKFFRVLPSFMVQWGMSGYPAVQEITQEATIPDDPVKESNTRGKITFAKSGLPDSRTTQVFINYADNSRLDADGFAPFGEVVEGMDVVEKINAESRERPNQGRILQQGNRYLESQFPNLDGIKSATVVEDAK